MILTRCKKNCLNFNFSLLNYQLALLFSKKKNCFLQTSSKKIFNKLCPSVLYEKTILIVNNGKINWHFWAVSWFLFSYVILHIFNLKLNFVFVKQLISFPLALNPKRKYFKLNKTKTYLQRNYFWLIFPK